MYSNNSIKLKNLNSIKLSFGIKIKTITILNEKRVYRMLFI